MDNPLAKLVPQFFGDYPKQFLELYNQVYVPPELNRNEIKDNLWKAFEFGSRYHEGQKRKSGEPYFCLLYTSPSPRDVEESRMPSSA